MYREEFADIYDIEYADFTEDIPFWKRVITGKKILEIGIGTGRIAVPLSKYGYKITGIERSPDMLRILQQKVKQKHINNIKPLKADMRNFDLKEKFDFAFIPFHLFHEAIARRDQERTLHCVREHLKRKGKLGIDLFHFRYDQLEHADLLRWEKVFDDPGTGEQWYRFVSNRVDQERQIIYHLIRYEYTGTPVKVLYCEVGFHYYTPFEILNLLEKCGFVCLDIYGDYQRGKFTNRSHKMIIIAERT
jgi:SAM-dependent methyltransferase